MKQLLAILLLSVTVTAYSAVEVNTYGLTDAEKAQLVQQAERMKQAHNEANVPTVEKVSEWVSIGSKVGLGLASAAKELGVQANEFAKTPVGKITMAIIVYKVAGTDLLKVVGAFTLLLASWFGGKTLNRVGRCQQIEYDTTTRNIFGNHPIKSNDTGKISSELMGAIYIFYAAGIIGCFLTLTNI